MIIVVHLHGAYPTVWEPLYSETQYPYELRIYNYAFKTHKRTHARVHTHTRTHTQTHALSHACTRAQCVGWVGGGVGG